MELTAYSAFKLLVVLAVLPIFLLVQRYAYLLPATHPLHKFFRRHGVYKAALMFTLILACVLAAVASIAWS